MNVLHLQLLCDCQRLSVIVHVTSSNVAFRRFLSPSRQLKCHNATSTPLSCISIHKAGYVKQVAIALSREDGELLEECLSISPAIAGEQRLLESRLSDVSEKWQPSFVHSAYIFTVRERAAMLATRVSERDGDAGR